MTNTSINVTEHQEKDDFFEPLSTGKKGYRQFLEQQEKGKILVENILKPKTSSRENNKDSLLEL